MSSVRFTFLVIVTITLLWLGYPAAFVATHGFNAQGWPDLEHTAYTWFQFPSYNTLDFIQLALVQVFTTYKRMALGQSPAFPDGGLVALICIISLIFSSGAFISAGMKLQTLRHRTSRFGDARFAASHVVTRMRTGVELGLDPKTKIPVRIQLEGNILTIAPPRRGKTSGLILPNLAYSDYKAFGGPVVVIDPKGDAYRAAHRRRTAMGRRVRCIDPLGIVGGTDRWNPLQTLEPNDVLYLQAMVQALLPAADATTEGGAFFRDRASVLLSAAMQVAIRDNHTDVAAAAGLINKPLLRLWLFAQTIGQIEDIYRDADRLMEMMAVRCFMEPSGRMAQELSKELGTARDIWNADKERPLATPQELSGPEYADKVIVQAGDGL